MFWAPVGTTDRNSGAWSFVSYGTNQTAAGRFSGGVGTGGSPSIPGQAIGTQVNVLFRGWSANLGVPSSIRDSAYLWNYVASEVAFSSANYPDFPLTDPLGHKAFYGESDIATVILGGGALPIYTPFGTGPGQITGFTLYDVVPEPATSALAVLGAAALLFRRFTTKKSPNGESRPGDLSAED
jgi:hypothetical protein